MELGKQGYCPDGQSLTIQRGLEVPLPGLSQLRPELLWAGTWQGKGPGACPGHGNWDKAGFWDPCDSCFLALSEASPSAALPIHLSTQEDRRQDGLR